MQTVCEIPTTRAWVQMSLVLNRMVSVDPEPFGTVVDPGTLLLLRALANARTWVAFCSKRVVQDWQMREEGGERVRALANGGVRTKQIALALRRQLYFFSRY
jgi:hypothetical protein